ncbi:MAG TPA: serine hydrolase [Blastocatellia bacterium]|jgi:CubicO group peptidase (beta-lactamase class C family)|nr:serine hydrolase [Blastocatellia bacterium]
MIRKTDKRPGRPGLLALLVLLLAAAGAAQVPAPVDKQVAAADEYLSRLVRDKQFAGAALVARDGKVIMSKGYGMADLENGVPNGPRTKFRLGSITKQFTATAIMMLQERGKLSTQDPLCKYVEDCPEAWRGVTIRHLLTHTSGIPSYTNFPDFVKTMALPAKLEELIGRFKNRPLEFQPGEKFSYNNSGYILLGLVIEKVSGQEYESFLRQNIFEPLKMASTGYDHTSEVLKDRASGYLLSGDRIDNAPYLDMSLPYAAGALYSTVEDLYLWDQALYSEKLLSKKSFAEMFTPFKNNYAYGWGVNDQYGLRRISHGGGINGFSTFIARYPEEKATIIVLSNYQHANPAFISDRLERVFLADRIKLPVSVKVDPAVMKKYAGRYEADPNVLPNFILDVDLEKDQLWVTPSHESRRRLVAQSDTEFLDEFLSDSRITFTKDAGGDVAGMSIRIDGRDFTARRLELPPASLTGNAGFRLSGYPNARIVAVAGSFNNWNQSQYLFAREGDEWVARVNLPPGKHTYKFIVDGIWILDPANEAVEADERGNRNSVIVVK